MTKKSLFGANSPAPIEFDHNIAIIGLSVMLPGADDEASLVALLSEGTDRIRDFPRHRVNDVNRFVYYYTGNHDRARFFRGAWLDRVDLFDREQFRMTEAEANLCDPHQRLFLQTSWQAINDAGYGGKALMGSRTAVIACGDSKKGISYLQLVTEQAFDVLPLSLTGNIASFTPGRFSHLMDFHGPAWVIDTGCCSSLVGVHAACQGLAHGDYDYAVVGSSEINFLPLDTGLRVGIESGDGFNRSFSGHASGTGFGEGAIAVLLKRHRDAVRDGDAIHAVIRGSAINHGGHAIGLTTPTPAAQADVIESAWRNARIHPDELGYVEAHGTATAIGDPIEWQGLNLAFRRYSTERQRVAIGSFKSYIGHLMNSAGLAGLARAVMSVKHGRLFPSLHFTVPNPAIDFTDSPFHLNDRLRDWPVSRPRLASVSSFGMSGTNCHLVIEAVLPVDQAGTSAPTNLLAEMTVLTLSGRTPELLRRHAYVLRDWIAARPDVPLGDIAGTLAHGREHYMHRVALVAADAHQAVDALGRFLVGIESPEIVASSAMGDQTVRLLDNAQAVARAYVAGAELPSRIPGAARFVRLHLPSPPLALERYWLDASNPTLFDRYARVTSAASGLVRWARGMESWLAQESVDPQASQHLAELRALIAADRDAATDTIGTVADAAVAMLSLVTTTFARKLGVERVDPDWTLTELGVNSMTAIQVASTLSNHVDLVLADVYQNPTPRALARELLLRHSAAKPDTKTARYARHIAQIDALLSDDSQIAADRANYEQRRREALAAIPAGPVPEPLQGTVLLTGATGFLGNHLLQGLLDRSPARIIVVVRANSLAEGLARLQDVYNFYHGSRLTEAQLADRVELRCGDIALPRMGLSDDDWWSLATRVDHVIHLAARVRHAGDEAQFERDNVEAVAQAIALCREGRSKRLHFASSMAVGHGHVDGAPSVRLFTEFDDETGGVVGNPYSRSKIAAERLVRDARAQGLLAAIYRFGNIVFRSTDGCFQRNADDSGVYALVRAFATLGLWPASQRQELDLGCVDHMTSAFLALAATPGLENGTFHVYNHERISIDSLCNALADAGYSMRRVPLTDFLQQLERLRTDEQHVEAVNRLTFHLGYLHFNPEQSAATLWRHDDSLTSDRLLAAGLSWLRPGATELRKMIDAAIASGFLPSPTVLTAACSNVVPT
ncbi:thioester reductase domain-containing protein [Burkholderia cenocepacia]|uniref:thioester reductase domain-containing protein n=1 Tax=Burkholderia cenocepacia TaxID=95486 RepID=UPI00163ABD8A|nr:thioester reductase domain-containing protein [Burkholderia cenocepacia]